MSKIEKKWQTLCGLIVVPDASPEQLREMRRLFFCGAQAMLELVVDIPDHVDDLEAHMAGFESLQEELAAFVGDITAGRA